MVARVNYVSYGPCAICKRDCDESSVNVDFAGTIVTVCGICMDKADDGPDLPLDMTEDDEQLREGLPEFNGAFKSW